MSFQIIIKDQNCHYTFYEDYYTEEEVQALKTGLFCNDYTKNLIVVGFVNVDKYVGCHLCEKSKVWEDITGYNDELQKEDDLELGRLYIVCYYKYLDGDLEHCVDFGISKEQIIKNVIEQKYIEGAYYFTIDQLLKI